MTYFRTPAIILLFHLFMISLRYFTSFFYNNLFIQIKR